MNEKYILERLIKVANSLDKKGRKKESDEIDFIIKKMADEMQTTNPSETGLSPSKPNMPQPKNPQAHQQPQASKPNMPQPKNPQAHQQPQAQRLGAAEKVKIMNSNYQRMFLQAVGEQLSNFKYNVIVGYEPSRGVFMQLVGGDRTQRKTMGPAKIFRSPQEGRELVEYFVGVAKKVIEKNKNQDQGEE